MINICLLRISTPKCHPQGIFQIKGTQFQYTQMDVLGLCTYDLKNSLKMASVFRNT